MGWKSLKEHYGIKHIVRVEPDKGICIGSGYVHDLIIVKPDGSVHPNKVMGWSKSNEDLTRYRTEMEADPAMVRKLVEALDTFSKSITVYTYDYDGNIIEKQCEETGWPNCTHDGECMYEKTFSTDRAQVVEWARENLSAAVESCRSSIADAERELTERRQRLERYMAAWTKLEAALPAPPSQAQREGGNG